MKTCRNLFILSGITLSIITGFILWPQLDIPIQTAARSAPGGQNREIKRLQRFSAVDTGTAEVAGEAQPFSATAIALEPLPVPDFATIDAFDGWVARWKEATPGERAAMTVEGARLAAARRPQFKVLIEVDPRLALERAVPRVVRQDLPEEIVVQLEEPVSAKGDFSVYGGRPAPGTRYRADQLTLRYFEAGGVNFKARVFGAIKNLGSRPGVPLQGVAIDREMAVAENAVRRLESGERIPAGTVVEETCPISGETSASVSAGEEVTTEAPVVEVAGRVLTFCEDPHAAVLEEQFRSWLEASGTGGAGFFTDNFPGTAARAIGNLRCLYIRATYQDQVAAPNTEEEAYNDMRNSARFFLENSYGKLTTTTTVTSLVTLPQTMAWYKAKDAEVDGLGLVHTDSRNAARALGYDSDFYDCIIVRINGGPRLEGYSWGGGTPANRVWITWGGMDVINHEAGHAFGRSHARFWQTDDGTGYGNGTSQDYGNPFDIMGGSEGFTAHYNTISKRALGWLPPEYIHEPKTSGTYRLHAYDQPRLEEGKRYALTVAKDSFRKYNLEYHPARGGLLTDSALVLYDGASGNNAGDLLDTTPDTPYVVGDNAGKLDASIALGRTFSDLEADMHFTVVASNATTPSSIDVVYLRGPFPGNSAPALALNTTATNIAVNGSVTFTAVANDADGDMLAYHWEFDDGVSAANSSQITRTFAAAAQVTAMVTVSDMKGGTTRRHMVINVGAHGRQTVTGNITLAGQPMANVRVSITSGKFAYTDAAGNYALAGVTTGNQTLTAKFNGHTLTPSAFANPLNVVAGNNTANWTAAASSVFVTLATTADATEGGANGTFTLTRSGSTAAALVVRVSPAGGTAAKPADYGFAPDYTNDGNYRTFTIPAGQASLAIAVAAVNDAAQEGPETISLQLASNGSYLLNSASSAVMTVNDNDTALPQVAVISNDPYATEFPADTGSFTFTRTGSTAAALNLAMGWTGTATSAADYAALPAVVAIPAGQASFTLAVVPLNDVAIEAPETIIATISTNAAYVRDTARTSATVTLSDDDAAVVTVSVPDAAASEAGPDSGLFLIHRSGSTVAPLKVYYGVHGTAHHGTDYGALNGEVIIPAGASSAPVVIAPNDDAHAEPSESVILAVTTFNNGYSLGPVFQGTLAISDNADLPVVSVRVGTVGVEGGVNPTVTFRAVGRGAGNVVVNYAVSGTATSGTDFPALAGSVSIPVNGPNDVAVTIPITNDAVAEPSETVVITLTPGAAYRIYNDASAEAIIHDNDSGERVTVSTWNQTPAESGAVQGSYYFSRTGTAGNLTVNYATAGTAINGTDYANLTGSVIIPDGQSGVDVAMVPTDDNASEGTETVTLTVLAGAGYGAGRPASATYEIIDSESPALTVGFQAARMDVSETDAAGEYRDIPVTLSAASADIVTVQYAAGAGSASGDDVDWSFVTPGNVPISSGTLTFAPGVTAGNIRVRVKNDGLREPVETVALVLRAPRFASLGNARQTLLVFDDEPSAVVLEERWNGAAVYTNQSWNAATPNYFGTLSSLTPATDVASDYSRRLIGQIVAPVTGNYQFWIASDDASRLYLSTTSLAANRVQIASVANWTNFQEWTKYVSQVSVNIPLVAGQSYYVEVQHQEGGGTDHVSVAWQGPGFARTPVTFATPESAMPRFVRLAAAATSRSEAEGGEPLLMAMLDRPAGSTPVTVDFTVGGTATAGSDFTLAPGTLVFAAGEQVKHLPLAILADSSGEAPEAIVVSLANPTGASLTSPATHVVTVLDAEAPAVGTQYVTASSSMGAGTVVATAGATPAAGRMVTGWSIVAGNTGGAFAINAAGQISLALPAALPNPGGVVLVVRAIDDAGSPGDGLVHIACNAAQGVVEQRWNGRSVFDFEMWDGTPSFSGALATFTSGLGVADNYSRRLTGYLKPEVSGDYTFWVAGDDDCRLNLSSDSSPLNKSRICGVSGSTNFQSWDLQTGQKSGVITLQAGKVYWLEAHQREGGGGDHVSVAWQGPGIARQAIPAAVIFPNVAGLDFDSPPRPPTIVLTSPASGAAFETVDDIALTANIAGGSPAVTAVEFYRGSTLIGSDASAPYAVTWTNPIAGNHALTAKAIFSGGGASSSAATVTVTNSDPAADPDGDGFTTGLELALGTDPQSSASQPPAIYAALRAWWKFNESDGTLADDSTGRPQDGVVTGATWNPGITGNALAFNGVDDGVLMGSAPALTGPGDFTVSAWVNVAPGSSGGTIIQQREPGGSGYLGQYALNVNPAGTVSFYVYGASGYQFNLITVGTIKDDRWHLISGSRQGVNGAIHIDGISAATGSASATLMPLESHAVSVGYDNRDNNKRFNGVIDDVKIHERILSAGELKAARDALVPNSAPVFTAASPSANATEDIAFIGQLAATDVDFGDSLTYSKIAGAAWLQIAQNGGLSGTPDNSHVGPNNATVRVTDAAGLFSDATLTVTVANVNDLPLASDDGSAGTPFVTIAEDATSSPIAVLANDSDVDLDPLTVTAASSPDGAVAINSGTTLSFTPAANFNGPTMIAYTISDGQGGTANATVFMSVTPVNDLPTITAVANQTTNEDTATSAIAFTIDDVETAPASLTVTRATSNTTLLPLANVVLGGSGSSRTVTLTPAANQTGASTITLTLSDGASSANRSFVVTVNPVNDQPLAVQDGSAGSPFVTIAEDITSSPIAVLANDSDVDLDPLTVTAASSPDGAVAINSGTTLSFTPATNFNGPTTIDYTISDGQGGTSSATVHVSVTPVNDLPVIGTVTADEQAISGDAYDSSFAVVSDADGDIVSFTKTSGPAWLVVSSQGGALSGSPAEADEGTSIVVVRATDPGGAWAEASFDLTVIVRRSLAVNFWNTAVATTGVAIGQNTNALNTAVAVSGPVVWNNQAINDAGNGALANGRGTGTYSGVTVNSFSSVPYQQGSSSLAGNDASQAVFRYYLDDSDGEGSYAGGDSTGASIHLTGLGQFLDANAATTYTLTLLFNADTTSTTAPFRTATVRSGVPAAPSAGAIGNLSFLGTIAPTLLGDGKQPLPAVGTSTTGKRGWGRLTGLSAGSITIAIPARSGSTRGSVSGFILTPTGGSLPLTQDGYLQWAATRFGEAAGDPDTGGEEADPNGDGVANLLAYAMGIDPLGTVAPGATAAQRGRIELGKGSGTFHFDYQRDMNATGVNLAIEQSADLAETTAWVPAEVVEEILSEAVGIRTIRATYTPTSGDTLRFFRLRASR
ncbi:tandem-95 repeat protein [Luteolibacter arcticus]|uniref:Tandem-95 repeat protein n=1 Tax=Luteolibacter arcticus TaxID=1581411 RepID=A0ABT3GNB7_9BACT|nr:tandem-95 repeat protein [Luteolibacter arcticus]MCW1925002.1 tandem-95 repeat protein [Luteolibacter arcticus]